MPVILQPDNMPIVSLRAVFLHGSAEDPSGKEGLAWLASSMLGMGGTRTKTYAEMLAAFFPMGTGVGSALDQEMTVYTLNAHADTFEAAYALFREMLMDPGFREDDFERLRDDAVNYITVYLRGQNDEELVKEALLAEIFGGTRYGHTAPGTVTSLRRLTLDDVREFYRTQYLNGPLTIAVGGCFPADLATRLSADFPMTRHTGITAASIPVPVDSRARRGASTAILIEKPSTSVTISFGFPIEVRRGHADYAALLVAVSALGQHRQSSGRLFQSMRQLRGLNYGDYAYIEHFPGGMYSLEPGPNVARAQQIFEIWIRPVERKHAHFALRLAVWELARLVSDGLTQAEFERTRSFLTKYVHLLLRSTTVRLGYDVDSMFYGIPAYAEYLRSQLAALTLDDVNAAIRRHLRTSGLRIAMCGPEMELLRRELIEDAMSPIGYTTEKPAQILAADEEVSRLAMNLTGENARVTPVGAMFE